MKTKSLMFSVFAIFLSCILLAGCGSTRIVSTIKPSADPDLAIDNVRFNISSLNLEYYDGAEGYMKGVTKEFLKTRAMSLYPSIFSNELTALPIKVNVAAKLEVNPTGAMLTALTVGVIPFPVSEKIKLNIEPIVRSDLSGDSLVKARTDLEVSLVTWMSLIGPLGCIPVPGHADLPRDEVFLFIPLTKDAYSTTKLPNYIADCMVEAIAKSLLSADKERLASAYRVRSSRLRKVVIEGRDTWCFVAPVASPVDSKVRSLKALFYNERPTESSIPFEEVVVAKLSENGRWEPVTSYLRSTSRLVAASCVIDNGLPGPVTLKTVTQPPVEDFIRLPEPATAEDIRWSNNMLIEAKNTTLPRMLRYKNRSYLIELINKIEKEVLHLNELAQLSDSRAQQIVLNGGDPSDVNQIAVLCRQRITIFKSILAALKRALAG